jgi:hypothetical protein
MSAPQRQVLFSVQHLANFFSYLEGTGRGIDEESETYQRLTQGMSGAEIAEAQHYAGQAEQLRQELLAAPEGTRISELPSYGSLIGLSPVANVLHVYGERDLETDTFTPAGEYRSDPHALGPGTTLAGLVAAGQARDLSEWTPPASELDVEYDVDFIKPFDLYV